jgi:rod shape determining protein RodA
MKRLPEVIRERRLRFDWPLLLVTVALAVLGLATLLSATISPFSEGLPATFRRQVMFMGIGLVGLLGLAALDPRFYERIAYAVFGVVIAMLAAVLVIGAVRGGSQRWLDLGPFNIQPSELAKLALVLASARYFASRPRDDGWGMRDLIVPAVLFLLPLAGLVFVEPDLGTSLFLMFTFIGLSFMVGLRWRTLAVVFLVGAMAAPGAYFYVLDEYQQVRVNTMLRPDADPKGAGYQSIQGRYAIGSGQWTGKGFGEGTQGRLRFLPEQHTDFIFSIYAEERGFLGCLGLLALYFGQMLLGLWAAWNARDRFGSILASGVVMILFCQVCINLGGVLGLMPITGVTLPFMSYGGSSILTMLLGVGLLMSVSMRRVP